MGKAYDSASAPSTTTHEIERRAPLTFAEGSDFPTIGSLRLASGNDYATFTFNGNTATSVTSAGVSGTISEADLENFDPGC